MYIILSSNFYDFYLSTSVSRKPRQLEWSTTGMFRLVSLGPRVWSCELYLYVSIADAAAVLQWFILPCYIVVHIPGSPRPLVPKQISTAGAAAAPQPQWRTVETDCQPISFRVRSPAINWAHPRARITPIDASAV